MARSKPRTLAERMADAKARVDARPKEQGENIFAHLRIHGHDLHFVPTKKASGGPLQAEDLRRMSGQICEVCGHEMTVRILQLRERLERGEDLWHDDDRPAIRIPSKPSRSLLLRNSRGYEYGGNGTAVPSSVGGDFASQRTSRSKRVG